jgi:hypothetical protein
MDILFFNLVTVITFLKNISFRKTEHGDPILGMYCDYKFLSLSQLACLYLFLYNIPVQLNKYKPLELY